MKSKTIRNILNNKIEDWKKSISNDKVKEAIDNSVIVTGGAIASMLLDEDINDFDVYFSNKDDAMTILKYYQNGDTSFGIGFPEEWNGHGGNDVKEENRIYIDVGGGQEIEWDEDNEDKYKPKFISNNAITLEGDIQLIFRFIGDAETIHENYDFVHCTNYWTKKDNNLVLRSEALECLLAKELRYIGSKYPICSLIRTRKYINRGFTCNAGEFLKMAWQVSELDLSDPNVLREQLVGVDIHYFNILINAITEKRQKEDDNWTPSYEYIMEIINRIFR